MQSFVITLLACSATMSALALFYMAATPFLAKRYSERGRYYAWLVIVIGLIIPFRPHFRNALVKVEMSHSTPAPMIQIGKGAPVPVPAPVKTAFSAAIPHTSVWQIAAAVWMVGMLLFLIYHVVRHFRFLKLTAR